MKYRINSRVVVETRHDKENSEAVRGQSSLPYEERTGNVYLHRPFQCHLVFVNDTHVGYVFTCRQFMTWSTSRPVFIYSDGAWVTCGTQYKTMRAAAKECAFKSDLGKKLLSLR